MRKSGVDVHAIASIKYRSEWVLDRRKERMRKKWQRRRERDGANGREGDRGKSTLHEKSPILSSNPSYSILNVYYLLIIIRDTFLSCNSVPMRISSTDKNTLSTELNKVEIAVWCKMDKLDDDDVAWNHIVKWFGGPWNHGILLQRFQVS